MDAILKDLPQRRKEWEKQFETGASGAADSGEDPVTDSGAADSDEDPVAGPSKVARMTPTSIAAGTSGPPEQRSLVYTKNSEPSASAIQEVMDTGVQNLRNMFSWELSGFQDKIEHLGQDLADMVRSEVHQQVENAERDRQIQTLTAENQHLRVSIGQLEEQRSVTRIDNQELSGRNFDLIRENRLLRDENQAFREASRHLEANMNHLQEQLTTSQAQVTVLQERRIHLCVGCYTEPVTQLARPCNHIPFCQRCLQSYHASTPNSQRCPVCRENVTMWERVFLGMTNNQ